MYSILFLFGTRPEAIKMAPLIRRVRAHRTLFESRICITAQHRSMLDQILRFFQIQPDFDLDIMKANQTLFDISSTSLKKIEQVLNSFTPDLLMVQGDTTTAMIGALCGYYRKIKVAHLEAGLRSGDKYAPYPEEINRSLIGRIADYHFAPTVNAMENLNREGIRDRVWVVGNTIIDALLFGLSLLRLNGDEEFLHYFNYVDSSKKTILVTAHRRESFGEPLVNICMALKRIVERHADVEIVYPVHRNPNVRERVFLLLGKEERIHLIDPLDYPHLIWLLEHSYCVLTDSGGIQEEAPTLGKPVLVMRDVTERVEGIAAGTAKLVGTDPEKIVTETTRLVRDHSEYEKMSKAVNPYGNGTASEQIVEILKQFA